LLFLLEQALTVAAGGADGKTIGYDNTTREDGANRHRV